LAEPAPVLSRVVLALRPVRLVSLLDALLSAGALLLRLLVPGVAVSLLRSVASAPRPPDCVTCAGVVPEEGAALGELGAVGEPGVEVFCAAAMPSAPAVPSAATAVTMNLTWVILVSSWGKTAG